MIRPAKTSDANAISEIIYDAWQTAYSSIIDPAYPINIRIEKYSNIFSEIIHKKTETVFVYEIEGTVIGFVSGITLTGKYDSEIKGLYISPKHQGNGLGTALLIHMKKYFKSKSSTRLILWTLLGASNNSFYTTNNGIGIEKKKLTIGSNEYQGIGYFFDLRNEN